MADSDSDPPRDVLRLRELRAGLEQLTRELMEWIALLRHKAFALRAIAGKPLQVPSGTDPSGAGLERSLTPGFLDPRVLADALAGNMPLLRSDSSLLAPLRSAGLGAEEAISRARAVWDKVADPADAAASSELADAAEKLATQLEERVNEALDEYDVLGDELARSLAAQPVKPWPEPDTHQTQTDTDTNQKPGRNA